MIELIFVIVILGILAAVAIPKLAATRDDAKISKMATDITTAKNEISSYIIARGVTDFESGETVFENASNTLKELNDAGTVSYSGDTVSFLNPDDDTETCLTMQVDDTNTSNVQLVITQVSTTSSICNGVNQLVKEGNVTVAGSRVKY